MPRSARLADSELRRFRDRTRRDEGLDESSASWREIYRVEFSSSHQLDQDTEHSCPAFLSKPCHPVHLTLCSLVGQLLPRAGAPPEYFCSQCVDDAIAEEGHVLGLPREEPVLASLSLESLGVL